MQPDFTLPALTYGFDALEPHIDRLTMEIHHGRHHQAYINNLNAARKGTAYESMTLEQIVRNVAPEDTAVRNNGGGHYNHTLFWEIMAPGAGGEPTGKLADAISAQFGSFSDFSKAFTDAAKSVFGSGWAWLCARDGQLFISTTPNQDCPLMEKVVAQTGTPLLGLDVWEHAYYLKYQNKRPDYIAAFFNLINWERVAERLPA